MLVHLSAHNLVDNLYVHGMNMLVGMVLGIAWVVGNSTLTTEDAEDAEGKEKAVTSEE